MTVFLIGTTMTKAQLIQKLIEAYPRLEQHEVEQTVDTFFDRITAALARGERIELRGFGTFFVRRRGARVGRNPRTGDIVDVVAKHFPAFKTSKALHNRLNQPR